MSGSNRIGRPPTPVWIDGIKFESSREARKHLKVSYKWTKEFEAALRGKCLYKGHTVSLVPTKVLCRSNPEPSAATPLCPIGPLLKTLCTHRLGVHGGGPA